MVRLVSFCYVLICLPNSLYKRRINAAPGNYFADRKYGIGRAAEIGGFTEKSIFGI